MAIIFQTKNSNEKQVTIQDVDFQLSGNFSCEVTTDAPTFSTGTSSRTLQVVCEYLKFFMAVYFSVRDVEFNEIYKINEL